MPDAGDPLPPRVALLAYRMVQEGLTNALRYASADRVTIRLTQSTEELAIVVSDDGVGATQEAEGFGLRTLREHAAELGGTFRVAPGADGGFELAATVPLVPGVGG